MMPDLSQLILALLAGLAGLGIGWLHFASLEWIANRIVEGRLSAIGLQLGRMALLVGILFLFSQAGALVLLAGAAGILLGRVIVLKGVR
ncbi:ATP synthase subunit I [uncultured Hyphomonas sp.]|uniref:N-ATPase subunit AtpR n=1 Tax=uncultured Hyphomonas sp. TaxID=225298 RepID=UPI002AABD7D3|nr:ATP synthase subunit I [uncultured Hyphomonas sp.]